MQLYPRGHNFWPILMKLGVIGPHIGAFYTLSQKISTMKKKTFFSYCRIDSKNNFMRLIITHNLFLNFVIFQHLKFPLIWIGLIPWWNWLIIQFSWSIMKSVSLLWGTFIFRCELVKNPEKNKWVWLNWTELTGRGCKQIIQIFGGKHETHMNQMHQCKNQLPWVSLKLVKNCAL